MYPLYCFCVGNTVLQVPASGCLYAMVILGLMGDMRISEYSAVGGNWARANDESCKTAVHVARTEESLKYCAMIISIWGNASIQCDDVGMRGRAYHLLTKQRRYVRTVHSQRKEGAIARFNQTTAQKERTPKRRLRKEGKDMKVDV